VIPAVSPNTSMLRAGSLTRGLIHCLALGFGLALFCASATAEQQAAQSSSLATERLLLGAARAGERLVAVGEWGHIILSDDHGETWRQANTVPTRLSLTAVFFVDDKRGWAVGHDALILHSDDGGDTWRMQHSDIANEVPLLSIWFENAQHGIAVGAFSMLLETKNGGRTWLPRQLSENREDDYHLNDIFAGSGGSVFIAAEMGRVYRSRDTGESWEELSPGYEGSFWGGLGLGDDTLLIWGMRGHVFRSEDLGNSWHEVASGTRQSLQGGTLLRDGRVVLVGLGGVVLRSSDQGRSFKVAVQSDRLGLAAVIETTPGRVALFGQGGVEKPESWPAGTPVKRSP
jgi:photosystem II stability/assembly factor-like uncharacterized protein